ncbi:unnamed protein product [Ectocarpus sp. 12 AP-2014]
MGFGRGDGRRDQASQAGAGLVRFKARGGSVSSQGMRLIDGEGGCESTFKFFSHSFALLCPWTQAQLVLEGPHGCFERDVQREELVHVHQRAAAGILGALHDV